MPFIPIASIAIRNRQREVDRATVGQLKLSIASKGLLHAPIIANDSAGTFLVAGMHRLTAISELHDEAMRVTYDGITVPDEHTPVVNVYDLDPADLMEAELEENIIRSPISWQDRARAIAAIHALRKEDNPDQTFMATAKELLQKQGLPDVQPSGTFRRAIRDSVLLADNLHKPSVARARNATEAMGILLKEIESGAEAETHHPSYSRSSLYRQDFAKSVWEILQSLLPGMDEGLIRSYHCGPAIWYRCRLRGIPTTNS